MPTKIEWTDETWNPITGCDPVSAGCDNCYARRMATRLRGRYGYPQDDPFKVTLHPDRLDPSKTKNHPQRWRKPRMIFVASMGDLFHKDVPLDFVEIVRDIMMEADHHIYVILTKRPKRMLEAAKYFCWTDVPHIWLGVSVEDQKTADERIPILLQVPAAVRVVSIEPMLGEIDLRHLNTGKGQLASCLPEYCCKGADCGCRGLPIQPEYLDWVICGGETGPRARPMHPDWPRQIRGQCVEAGVPFFFKQWGEWYPEKCLEFLPGARIERDVWLKRRFGKVPWWLGVGDHGQAYFRVGKKQAGRLLDGKEWNQYPGGKDE